MHSYRSVHSDVGAATRALAEATATLTKMLGRHVSASVGPEVGDAIATSLREAARGLSDASESVERRYGRGDDRRRAKVDRTRADLLAAAEQLVAARGFEGASVGDIAAAAGYTKGALYAHFGSKGDLFLELARECLAAEPEAAGHPGATGPDLADDLAGRLAASGDDVRVLLPFEILAYAVRHPEARERLLPTIEGTVDRLAAQVAARRGAGAPTSADRDAALGMLGTMNLAAVLAALGDQDAAASGSRVIRDLLRDA